MVKIVNEIQNKYSSQGLDEAIRDLTTLNKEKQKLQQNSNIDINVKNTKLKQLDKDILDTTTRIKSLTDSTGQLGRKVESIYDARAKRTISDFQNDLRKIEDQMIKYNRLAEKINSGNFGNANKSLLEMERALKNNNTAAEQLRKNFGIGIMQTAAFGSINALGNVFSDALDQVKNIDKVLTDIKLVSNKSAEEMKKYSEYAGEAASQLGSTKQSILEANLIYEQQGGQAAQYAKEYGKETVIGANISGESSKDVSQYLTSSMNGFDLMNQKGRGAARYVNDVFGEVGAVSGSDYGELAKSLAQFANIANNSNFNFEQSTAMAATIGEITRKAPEAVGTALKSIMATFQQITTNKDGVQTNKAEKAINEAGVDIETKNKNGTFRSAEEILNDLGEKWSSLNKDQKGIISSGIAGKHHGESFQALMENWDRYQELYEDAQNSAGAAMRQQEIYMDSIQAKQESLKNSWQEYVTSLNTSDVWKSLLGFADGFAKQMAAGESSVLNLAKGLAPVANIFMMLYGKQKIGEAVTNNRVDKIIDKRAAEERKAGKGDITDPASWIPYTDKMSDKAKTYVNNQLKEYEANEKAIGQLTKSREELEAIGSEITKQIKSVDTVLDSFNQDIDYTKEQLINMFSDIIELSKEEQIQAQNLREKMLNDAGNIDWKKDGDSYIPANERSKGRYNDFQEKYQLKDSDIQSIAGSLFAADDKRTLISDEFENTIIPKFDRVAEKIEKASDRGQTLAENKENIKSAFGDLIRSNEMDIIGDDNLRSRADKINEELNSKLDNTNFNDKNQVGDLVHFIETKVQNIVQIVREKTDEIVKEEKEKSAQVQKIAEDQIKQQKAIQETENLSTKEIDEKVRNEAGRQKTALQENLNQTGRNHDSITQEQETLRQKNQGIRENLTPFRKGFDIGAIAEKLAGAITGTTEAVTGTIGMFQALNENGWKANEQMEDIVSSGLTNIGMGLMAIHPLLGALTIAAGQLIDVFDMLKTDTEKMREANKKLLEVYQAQTEKLQAKQSAINDNKEIIDKYAYMSDEEREGALEGNPEDKAKWDQATQTIAEQMPELVKGLDENGKAIIDLTGGSKALQEKLNEKKLDNNKMMANNADSFGAVARADMETGLAESYKYQAKIKEQTEVLNSSSSPKEIAEASAKLSEYQSKLQEAQETLNSTKASIQNNLIEPIFNSNKAFAELTGEARKAGIELKSKLFNTETVQAMIESGESIDSITGKMRRLADTIGKLAKDKGFKELSKNLNAADIVKLNSGSKKDIKELKKKEKVLSDKDKKNDKKYNSNAGLDFVKKNIKYYNEESKAAKKQREEVKKLNEEKIRGSEAVRKTQLAQTMAAPNAAAAGMMAVEQEKAIEKTVEAETSATNLKRAMNELTPAYAAASQSAAGFQQSAEDLSGVLGQIAESSGEEKEALEDAAFAMMSGMAEANDEFYKTWVDGSEAMVQQITDMYGVDLREFESAAQAKAAIMASAQIQAQVISQAIANGDDEKEIDKKLDSAREYIGRKGQDLVNVKNVSAPGAEYKGKDGKTYKNDSDSVTAAMDAGQKAADKKDEAEKEARKKAKKEADDKAKKEAEDAKKAQDKAKEKEKEEKTPEYNRFEALQKEADKYYAITESINEMNRAYDKLKRARDKAFSSDKLAILEEETKQLKYNIDAQKTAVDIYKQEANAKKAALQAQGFTFDENGIIANKNAMLDSMTTAYNQRALELNQQEKSDGAEREMENRRQAIEDTEKLIADYNEANSKMKEQSDAVDELKDKLQEIAAEKWQVKIDIVGDAIEQQTKIIDTLNEINKENDKLNTGNIERSETKASALLDQFRLSKQMYNEVKNDSSLSDAAKEEKMKQLTDVMASSAKEAMSAVEEINDEIDSFIEKIKNEFEYINKNVDRIMQKAQDLTELNGRLHGEDSDEYMKQLEGMNKLRSTQDEIAKSAIAFYKKQQSAIDTTTSKGKEQFQELSDLIAEEEDKISENFKANLDDAENAMSALTDKVINMFGDAEKHINRAFDKLTQFNSTFENIFGTDSSDFTKQEDAILEMRKVQMDHAKETIKVFKKQQSMIDQNTKAGKEQWKQYQEGIEAAEDVLVNGMLTTLEDLDKKMRRINETVIKAFNDSFDETNRVLSKTNEYKDAFLNFSGMQFDGDYAKMLNTVNQARASQNEMAQDAIDFYKNQMQMIDVSTKAGKEQYEQMKKEVERMGDVIQKNLIDGMKDFENAMKSITSETIRRFNEVASIVQKTVSKQNQVASLAKNIYGGDSQQYIDQLNSTQALRDEQDKIAKQTIDFYKKQQEQLDLTTNAGKEQWKQYQDGIEKAEDLISNNLTESLNNLQAQMEAMNKQTLKAFTDAFGSDGLGNLQNQYNMQNKAQDKYLSGLEKANKLSMKRAEIMEKISHSTDNEEIAMYNKYLKDVLKPLEDAKTINEHDLGIAEAKLEVAKAELEVRRQGDADLQARLVRDNQGNMTYEYYQKETEKGQNAIANYNKAIDNLQSKMRDTVKSTAAEIQETFNNMQNTIQKMAETKDEEERKRLQKQLEAYQEYYNQLMKEYQNYTTMLSSSQVSNAFNQMNNGMISKDQLASSMGVDNSTIDAMNQANKNGMSFDSMASMSQEDLSSKLGISMDQAGAALNGMQSGGGFDIQSLSGMIQNMYDTWQQKSQETLTKLQDNLNQFNTASNDTFNKALGDIENYKTSAELAFSKLNGSMQDYINKTQENFQKLKDGYNDLADKANKSMQKIDTALHKSYTQLAIESAQQFKKASAAFSEYADTVKKESASAFKKASKEFENYNSRFNKDSEKALRNINKHYSSFRSVASSALKKVDGDTHRLTGSSRSLEKQMGNQKKAADKVSSSAVTTSKRLNELRDKANRLGKSIREEVNKSFTGSLDGTGKRGMFGAMTKNAEYARKEYYSAIDKARRGNLKTTDQTNLMAKSFSGAKTTMSDAFKQAIKFDTNNREYGKKVKDGIDKIASSIQQVGANADVTAEQVDGMRGSLEHLAGVGGGKKDKDKDKGDSGKKYKYQNPKTGRVTNNITYDEAKKLQETFNGGKIQAMATGGYTGEWTNSGNNKEGRLALLHEKELVLNAEDTKNILQTVSMQRELADIMRRSPSIDSMQQQAINIKQNVQVNAEFPSVNNRIEIMEAFNGIKSEAISYLSNNDN